MAACLPAFPADGPTLVGFSGGLDSTVLLHALAHTPAIRAAGLRAIHVHHGLHAGADAWAAHCARVCAALGIDCRLRRVTVVQRPGDGPEASARRARYQAFAEELGAGERLALAHHRDDQAETVLLRLLRGSASHGLAAMRETRGHAQGRLWRPLLPVPRQCLLDYARAHDLVWIDDPSNADQAQDRNFLRHRVLPLLHERWPAASEALARSAALLAEDAHLLDEEAGRRLALVQRTDPDTVSAPGLAAMPPAWRHRVLRAWLATRDRPPLPGTAFAELDRLLLAAGDAIPEYRWAGQVLRRWRDQLYVEAVSPPLPAGWWTPWDGEGELPLPGGDSLRLIATATITAAGTSPLRWRVAARRGGERIRLPHRHHSHQLKHVLQDRGVPPWQRARLPLLFADDGELLAAGDLAVSARFAAWQLDSGRRLHWRQAPR